MATGPRSDDLGDDLRVDVDRTDPVAQARQLVADIGTAAADAQQVGISGVTVQVLLGQIRLWARNAHDLLDTELGD